MSDTDFVVEYTIKIARNGDVTNDTVTHGNSYADIYRAFHQIKAEVDRQIAARRECPFNPKYGGLTPKWLRFDARRLKQRA